MARTFHWLRLFRLPNLLTVPGDALAGGALAAWTLGGWSADMPWPRALAAGGAALLVYMAGLVNNDLADLAEDRRERPDRPIASGAISVRAALVAFALLSAGAVVLARAAGAWAPAVTLGLLAAVLLYNQFAKKLPVLGPLVMGLCRAGSVLLGASILGQDLWDKYHNDGPWSIGAIWLCAGGWLLYVAALTALAAGETRRGAPLILRVGPAIMMLAWTGALWQAGVVRQAAFDGVAMGVFLLLACGMTALVAGRLPGDAPPGAIQTAVGWLIRNLLFMQAAVLALLPETTVLAGVLVLLWLPAASLGRRFYQS